jgi:hypothetical protein
MKKMNIFTIIALILIFLGGVGAILLVIGQAKSSAVDKQEIINNTKLENDALKLQIGELKEERQKLNDSLEKRDQKIQDQSSKIEHLSNKLLDNTDYMQKFISGGEGYPFVDFIVQNKKPGETQKCILISKNESEFPLYNIHIEGYDYEKLLANTYKFLLNEEEKTAIAPNDFSSSSVFTYSSDLLNAGGGEVSPNEFEIKNSKYYITINTKNKTLVQKVVMQDFKGKIYIAYELVDMQGKVLKQHFYDNKMSPIAKEFIKSKLNEIPNVVTSYMRNKD